MISCVENGNVYEFRGLSEEKDDMDKDSVPNGCVYIAMDTGKVYMFDASIKDWREF